MPSPATLLLIAALLPLLSFTLLVFVGRRMGEPLAGALATAAVGGSLLCALLAMVYWYNGAHYTAPGGARLDYGSGRMPINLAVRWIPGGPDVAQDHPGWLDVGMYVDSLTVAMVNMITLVAALVHVFSMAYMRRDPRYARFFTYLGLFCFSMLGLVLSSTVLQIFIFWELVGLCSYLLIGFWFEKETAANAAIKAFVTNRVGDVGFMIGLGILFWHLGNATLPQLWMTLGGAGAVDGVRVTGLTYAPGAYISSTMLTLMGAGLFLGAMGKSAQFPLHVWLPDAMEGPTPVSALIHAATMVAAGVYLVGRIFPILTPDAKLFIAVVGVITLTFAALVALAQTDIKRVLAYSTISQLGYMMLAMGVGSWVGGLFHLITHAFFKALLFLGAGSVISAAHHEQELGELGGLVRKIPVTATTFLIAVLAIAGTPFFSGYYSKEMILAHAGAFVTLATSHGWGGGVKLLFWLPTAVAYLTAFYMMRTWMLAFWGKPRNPRLYERARERPGMWGPLVVLAALSVVAGNFLNVRQMLVRTTAETENYVAAMRPPDAPAVRVFDQAWTVSADEKPYVAPGADSNDIPVTADASADRPWLDAGERMAHAYAAWAFVVGIALAFLVYLRGFAVTDRLLRFAPVRWAHGWLRHAMYFDELYYSVFVATARGLSALAAAVDQYLIDGAVNLLGWSVKRLAFVAGAADRYIVDGAVSGVASLAQGVGAAVRAPQTGRVRLYVTVLLLAVAVGVAGAIVVVMSR